MKTFLKNAVSAIGYEIRRKPQNRDLTALDAISILRDAGDSQLKRFLGYVVSNNAKSHAQLFQDLFVLFMLKEKRSGYFVEFGTTDGLFLSNTALLESDYEWRGIVAEPSGTWHSALRKNRNCKIDLRCVWRATGETIMFSETENAAFSTVSDLKSSDNHDRDVAKQYAVKTVSSERSARMSCRTTGD